MVETYTVSLYTCGCGYKTTHAGNSNRHKKGNCGHEITVSSVKMVLEADYTEALAKAQQPVSFAGEQNVNVFDKSVDNSTHITNITLVLPEKTLKEDFIEYLETLTNIGYRTPDKIMDMPGKLLLTRRDPKTMPGAIIERNRKIIEKLPDGKERVMGKKKAVQTYTNEAVDALFRRPPDQSVADFLEEEKGAKRTKMSVVDASKMRVVDPIKFHMGAPPDVKHIQQKMETHTERCLDKITTQNRDAGFL
ncbi:protein of unknown function (DUF1390) [Acanthocystis turfacea Chlorella virus Canal-1]|nr:protein of unknown function (DUF1390) [Acanthocystis turfacea Chlorella virus Canal-1]